jgi:hypothetical protein
MSFSRAEGRPRRPAAHDHDPTTGRTEMSDQKREQPKRKPEGEPLDDDAVERVQGGLRIDGVKGESTDNAHKEY